eukprot:GEMP01038851.1.p2 GENE.GEMP01038851.1~~GEMP01038851.1.p2  ORF type:complete len:308 (+),score=91.03 GEMP01038851.1:136-1059(+)
MSQYRSQSSYPWDTTCEVHQPGQWEDTYASNHRAEESYSPRSPQSFNHSSRASRRDYTTATGTPSPSRTADGVFLFEDELYDVNTQKRVAGSSLVDTDVNGATHTKVAETHVIYFPHEKAPMPVVQATPAPSLPRRLPPPPESRVEYRTTRRVERDYLSDAHRPQDVIPHQKLEPKQPTATPPRPRACTRYVAQTASPAKTEYVVRETKYVAPPQKCVPAVPSQPKRIVTQRTVTTRQPMVQEQQVVYMLQPQYELVEVAPVVAAPMIAVAAPMIAIAAPMIAVAPVVAAPLFTLAPVAAAPMMYWY